MQKALKKEVKKKKNLNEEKEKRRIQGKSNNNKENLWLYLSYEKSYFSRKHSLKKSGLYPPSHFVQSFYTLHDI